MSDAIDQTPTEGAAPELPSEPVTEQDYDDLIAQAAAALDDSEPAEADTPAETAPEESAEAEATPEPTEDDKPAEGPAEVKDDEPAEDQSKVPAWQFAQLRRQQKALEREREEIRQLRDELAPLKDDLSAMPDPRREPLKFADWAAGRAGLTPQQLYELQTHRQLKDGEPDPMSEVQAIREELAQLKAERAEAAKAREEKSKAAQAAELLQADVDGVTSALSSVGPYAAAWPKGRLVREAQAAVQWAYEHAPEMTYEAIAKGLDGLAREEYEAIHQKVGKQTLGGNAAEDRDTSKARDGQGTPDAAASKPAGTPMPRSTLTNNDAAQGGAAHREMTDEERYAKAAAALAESL